MFSNKERNPMIEEIKRELSHYFFLKDENGKQYTWESVPVSELMSEERKVPTNDLFDVRGHGLNLKAHNSYEDL